MHVFVGKFSQTLWYLQCYFDQKLKKNETMLHGSNIDSHLHHDDATFKQFNDMFSMMVTECVLCAIGKFLRECQWMQCF